MEIAGWGRGRVWGGGGKGGGVGGVLVGRVRGREWVWEGCEWLWEVDGERDGDGRGS